MNRSRIDKSELTERAGKLSSAKLRLVLCGVDVVLGRGAAAEPTLRD